MAKKNLLSYGVAGLIVGIIFTQIGWAFHSIINEGIQDILSKYGIENIYLQNALLIVAFLLLAILIFILIVGFGKGMKKVMKKLYEALGG